MKKKQGMFHVKHKKRERVFLKPWLMSTKCPKNL